MYAVKEIETQRIVLVTESEEFALKYKDTLIENNKKNYEVIYPEDRGE